MKYTFISPPYKAAVAQLNLNTPDDWMRYTDKLVARDRTTETRRLVLPAPLPICYAKIYRYPRWDDRLRILFRGGLIGLSRAAVEFGNLRRLHDRGLSPGVIAYGRQRRWGLLEQSLLVLCEAPNTTAMDAFVIGPLRQLAAPQRRTFIRTLAEFSRTMNTNGFINSEYHWRNILVQHTQDRFTFQVIDPSSSRQRYRWIWPYFDAATLDICARYFFTRSERLRFLKIYWGRPKQPLTRRQKRLIGKLSALRDRLAKKEIKRYRHILSAAPHDGQTGCD